MASANLDLVRSIFADWERGDFSSAGWAHPEIEFVIAEGPSPGNWTGTAGMAEGFGDLVNAWEAYSVAADEYRELDVERVLVFLRLGGRGKTSGLDLQWMQTSAANLFHVRDGKVTRLVIYFDCERAFADLGLSRDADSLGS
jgi:ketosteroid isomerase-like protein